MMNKEIINYKDYVKALKDVSEDLIESVCKSLGPNGSTSIITDENGKPYITKDGVSILNAIEYENPLRSYILTIIKEGVNKTLKDVGDGTTTTTLFIALLLKSYYIKINNHGSYNLVQDIKNNQKIIEDFLIENSKVLNEDHIFEIAKTSTNGDYNMSALIKEAFSFSKNIQIKKTEDKDDILIYIEGIKYPVSYLHKSFINRNDTKSIEYDTCKVCIIEDELTDINYISDVLKSCATNDEPLLIIVDGITDNVMNLLIKNYEKNVVKLIPVKTPGASSYRSEYRSDIKHITGANIVKPNTNVSLEDLGELEGLNVNPVETILSPIDTCGIDNKVKELQTYLNEPHLSAYDKSIIEDRIKNLNGKLVIYNVGGNSYSEMMERYDRVEDAVGAINIANKFGVTTGGGVAFAKASLLVEGDVIEKLLQSPYFLINNKQYTESSTIDTSIIDPTYTLLKVINNAFSIVKTLTNVNSVIIDKRSWS